MQLVSGSKCSERKLPGNRLYPFCRIFVSSKGRGIGIGISKKSCMTFELAIVYFRDYNYHTR